MLQTLWLPDSHLGQDYKLDQDIIDACIIINSQTRELADPSKISHLTLPTDRETFMLQKSWEPLEMLISLVSRNNLNVCELLHDKDGEVRSIELPLEKVKEKLSLTEISAEIVLQYTLFESWYMDRSLMPWVDFLYDNDERFIAPVNMKYSEHSYSIFDLENSQWTFPQYKDEKDLIANIWQAMLCLYDRHIDTPAVESDYRLFLEFWRVDSNFWEHLAKKSKELLDIYGTDEWKSFFLKQSQKTQVEKWDELYERFIRNVRLMYKIFSENADAIEDYILWDRKLAMKDMYYHLRAIKRIIKWLCKRAE